MENGTDGGPTGDQGDIVLTVEATNKLRAELGLRPLRMDDGASERKAKDRIDVEKKKDSADKVRARIQSVKERRSTASSVFGTTTLAEELAEEEEGDAQSWIERTKQAEKLQKEKLKNARLKRAAEKKKKEAEAADSGPKGVQVKHSIDELGDEPMILTLADRSVLNENQDGLNEEGDELENVNLREVQRAKKNAELKNKNFRNQYDPTAESRNGGLLSKYDEEEEDTVQIADDGRIVVDEKEEAKRRELVRQKLLLAQQEADQDDDNGPKFQSDYMTTEEMKVFKKPKDEKRKKKKKVKKIRRKTAEEELLDELENEDHPAADGESSTKKKDERKQKMREIRQQEQQRRQQEEPSDLEDDDLEIREALSRARRAMNKEKAASGAFQVQEELQNIKKEEENKMDASGEGAEKVVVLDETSEFVRNIRRSDDEMETEDTEMVNLDADFAKKETEVTEGSRSIDHEDAENGRKHEEMDENSDEEEDAFAANSKGIAGALEHFRMVGDLNENNEQVGRAKDHRLDKQVLDKTGPRKDIKVKLEYVDEFGREMTPNEAFRKQCYAFHGKGPSKKKQEKRFKKLLAEQQQKHKLTGPDTPLESVKALKQETKTSGQAFVVLTGAEAITGGSGAGVPSTLSKGERDVSNGVAVGHSGKTGDAEGQDVKDGLTFDRSKKVAMTFTLQSSKRPRKEV